MTMVPSQTNKTNGDYVFYNNTTSDMNHFQFLEDYNNYNNNCLRSEFLFKHMAEEVEPFSRHNEPEPEPEPELETISTSKESEEQERKPNNNNWLQLSIGNTVLTTTTTKHDADHSQAPTNLLELELLPTNWTSSRPDLEQPSIRGCSTFNSSMFFEQTTPSSSSSVSVSMSMPAGPSYSHQQHLVPHNWAFGPLLPHSMAIMASSTSYIPSSSSSFSSSQSCSSLRPSLGPNYYPQYHHASPFHFPSSSSSGFDQFDIAGPSSSSHLTFRVVDPPRRPHSGIWFMLQASQNQVKEPFLPQIPKNYLRIKDGRMTVRLLMKYLVNKLKLESESEIEITCKGQQLLPFLTLQHVRDNIWTPRDTTTTTTTRPLLSDSSTTDHVMVLHYSRSTS
ncbi:protein LAX PANICLE 2-like [Vicia villosa]|uniref:protein LAX PANICLE 2-like n=1 Tax=Vicia villosa TaxID=3911 RepID=UPI00273B799A|nr:protein LAX PANICLE 2-like [Vicia villosa]